MIKEIIHDPIRMSMKASEASADDISVSVDLLDTLKAHSDECVGMAANMIGINKRIIAFQVPSGYMTMFNPEIIKFSGAFETEEGCLSLSGRRKVKRYKSIKVKYQNEKMQYRIQSFNGWTAQIIQHETDHCNGILI